MLQVLFVFIFFLATFLLFEATNNVNRPSKGKRINNEYLSDFKIYLCLKNRLLLYPPKEIFIDNQYYILNLATKNNLLPHKNIISKSNRLTKCTECLHRCIPGLEETDIIDLNLSFATFKNLSNHELKAHLKAVLTEEQYEYLFNKEAKSEA